SSSILSMFSTTLNLLSFPTRRSSDLSWNDSKLLQPIYAIDLISFAQHLPYHLFDALYYQIQHERQSKPKYSRDNSALLTSIRILDRKSTRLNSSHQIISYDVFFLKKN